MPPVTVNTTKVSTITADGSRIVWGFMFENTLFTEFERHNHPIIEAAYRQRKKKHCSHHITIVDSNLPKPGKAKVYFGVAQNHLRMPGTRYYVTRQVIRPTSSPFSLPMLMPSPTSTFSSSSFSSLDSSALLQSSSQQLDNSTFNSNTLAAVLSDDLPLVDFNYNTKRNNNNNNNSSSSNTCNSNGSNTMMDPYAQFYTDYLTNDNTSTYYYCDNNINMNNHLPTTARTTSAYIPDFNNMLQDPTWLINNSMFCLGQQQQPTTFHHQDPVSWSINTGFNNDYCGNINLTTSSNNNFFTYNNNC